MNTQQEDSVVRIFFSWIVGYVVLEPLTGLLILRKKNMTPLSLLTDFVYASIPFLKSMYVYKHIFKKPEYFPKDIKDLRLFLSVFVTILVVLDIIFLAFTSQSNFRYPLQDLLERYVKATKVAHIVHFATYGMIWCFITFFVYTKVRTLDAISIVIGSLFLILLLDYPEKNL